MKTTQGDDFARQLSLRLGHKVEVDDDSEQQRGYVIRVYDGKPFYGNLSGPWFGCFYFADSQMGHWVNLVVNGYNSHLSQSRRGIGEHLDA